MATGRVVDLPNGHSGICVEVLRGLTYCGETFDPTAHDVERFAVDERRDKDHPHSWFCFDCSKADSRKLRAAAQEVAN